jgi:hypothetical protein
MVHTAGQCQRKKFCCRSLYFALLVACAVPEVVLADLKVRPFGAQQLSVVDVPFASVLLQQLSANALAQIVSIPVMISACLTYIIIQSLGWR